MARIWQSEPSGWFPVPLPVRQEQEEASEPVEEGHGLSKRCRGPTILNYTYRKEYTGKIKLGKK